MWNEIMCIRPAAFFLISDRSKTQEMCIEAVKVDPLELYYVPDHFKNQKICDAAVREDPFSLQYVPDWFVKLKEMWYEDFDNDDDLITWYEGYKKRKAQKAKIKEELMPTAWHHTRMQDWCIAEDEKERTEEIFA